MSQLGQLGRSRLTEVEHVEDEEAGPSGEEVVEPHGLLEGPPQTETRGQITYREHRHEADPIDSSSLGSERGRFLDASRRGLDRIGSDLLRTDWQRSRSRRATVFAQLAAQEIGTGATDVVVHAGDTGVHPHGISTVASRTAATAGPAVHQAAVALAERVRELAADMLGAAVADLVLEGGRVAVAGQPGAEVTLAEVAAHARSRGEEPGATIEIYSAVLAPRPGKSLR